MRHNLFKWQRSPGTLLIARSAFANPQLILLASIDTKMSVCIELRRSTAIINLVKNASFDTEQYDAVPQEYFDLTDVCNFSNTERNNR